jgi:prevent-host-death family protein
MSHPMDDRTGKRRNADTMVGAYEAKTKFSELIARSEKGESFLVTKNGRPMARITPVESPFDRDRARRAAQRLRQLRDMQGSPVSEDEAQRNWENLKADVERERDLRVERWLKS